MELEPFADKLEADGVGTQGTDIFLYRMPPKVVPGILFLSPLRGTYIDYDVPGLRKDKFQVIVRAQDYLEGKALVDSIVASLTFYKTVLGSIYIHHVRLRTDPVIYPVSEGDFLEFSLNFETMFSMD